MSTRPLPIWTLIALLAVAPIDAAAAGRAPVPDRAPIPIHVPALEAPIEALGTGLSPEVSVRVTIDAEGRLSAVEVLSIKPSSPLDSRFEAVVRETLLRWRYAPALRGGVPVATQLSWTVSFPERSAADESEVGSFVWRPLARDPGDSEAYRRHVLQLPDEQRVRRLAELVERGLGLMSKEPARHLSTRFMVYTDAPDPEVARTLAGNLEATFNILQEVLGDQIDVQPEAHRIVVLLFASEGGFNRLKANERIKDPIAGFYDPVGMIAFHLQMDSPQDLIHVALHEAAHAFTDRYLARRGVVFPRWLSEGFADYLGSSTIQRGQLIPGRTRKQRSIATRDMKLLRASWEQLTLDELQKGVRAGEPPSLEQVVTATRDTFYGDLRSMNYAKAWVFVHYLRHGQPEWAVDRFPRLMLYVAEGYPPTQVLTDLYGPLDRLEVAFREYVLGF